MEALGADDPRQIGPYALRKRLGEGGMGRVFLGRSPSGRAVAVKVIHGHLARQADFRRRFSHEVAAIRTVGGAFTAPLVGADPDGDPPWLATLYVPGPNLEQAVATAGPLPLESLWLLAAGLAEALHDIHAASLLHRDLKPANVLLAADGPRVIDFGIARALDGPALTTTGFVIGTPGFMSPEQINGTEQNPASDVFALGSVLAYAATAMGPFGEGPPLALLHRITNAEPSLDDIPTPLRGLVASCLAKAPTARPTPSQILQIITAVWSPPEHEPTTAPWPTPITRLLSRHGLPDSEPQPDATAIALQEPTLRYTQAEETSAFTGPLAAAREMEQVAADRARVLGSDHPDTLASRHRHAYFLGETGHNEQAAELSAQVAADRARALGPDHPGTLASRANHASYLGEAGHNEQAVQLMEQVAADRARVLGPDHPDTLISRDSHAWFMSQIASP
jgi:serine/threonine protein kinase